MRKELDKARLYVALGFMEVFQDLYPEDQILDRLTVTRGAVYWRGFKSLLKEHFSSYVVPWRDPKSNTGYVLLQQWSLLNNTVELPPFNQPQVGPRSDDTPLMGGFHNPRIAVCDMHGYIPGGSGENIYTQLFFFCPNFIWKFNRYSMEANRRSLGNLRKT